MDSPTCDSSAARAMTVRFLSDHCPWADPADVQLVVTELLTNALRHTEGWWRLRLRAEPDELSVEVDDSSRSVPVARTPDFTGGGGFGWPMVCRLAGRVEIRPRPTGKTVRAVWDRPSLSARAREA
ncbi:ATP-binding protein [Streptomyces sp. SP18CS02]|uniref:ATP-binding protein n=1 Tax=Streptomyces sp. SP18CS02 TaxID=3002531 RepID=UPI002E76FEE1|nr:ATP-binding protein [Streptomyces sp. SP18CS02]MEE1751444.1 ATP-binding protein [Streptomyces sp. SP18CS02]